MDRWLTGAAALKRKQTQKEKLEYQKHYEKRKRARKFDLNLNKDREWLVNTDEGMKCTTCKDMIEARKVSAPTRKNVFLSGCTSLTIRMICQQRLFLDALLW